jgi:integrase
MILTTYSHGLRAAETCRLKIADLDMRSSVLSIHRLKGSLFTIQELERHRGIPLLDEVKALKVWLAVRPTDCGDALFTSQKGNHLTPDTAAPMAGILVYTAAGDSEGTLGGACTPWSA